MARDLARFVVLIAIALAFVLTAPARAHAQGQQGQDDVTVLTPPPVPPVPNPVPDVRPPSPEVTRLMGQTVVAVDVVVDDLRWSDVRPPLVTVLRAGDKLTAALVRQV